MIWVCRGTCVQIGICGCVSVGSDGRPCHPPIRWSSSENHEHWLIHRHILNRKYVFDFSFQSMVTQTETTSWYYLAVQSLILNLETITETTGLIFTGTGIYLSWLAEVAAETPSLNGKFSGMLARSPVWSASPLFIPPLLQVDSPILCPFTHPRHSFQCSAVAFLIVPTLLPATHSFSLLPTCISCGSMRTSTS